MARMAILTDSETATGFRLAGVEVHEAEPDQAQEVLEQLIASNLYGLVAVDEGLIGDPVASSERAMRGRELPVLLPIPSLGAAFDEGGDALEYMRDLVRHAIGFDLKLE